MVRRFYFLFTILLSPAPLYGAVDLTLSPSAKTVKAGTTERVNFNNTGASTGRYQMFFDSGRESWMTIHNDNNNITSGYIKLDPPVGVTGTFTVKIRANKYLSSEKDVETLVVTVTAGTTPLTLSVSNTSFREHTTFQIPVSVNGGRTPYTGTITSGSFPGSDQLYFDRVTNRLLFSSTNLNVISDKTYHFTLRITDADGTAVSDSFSVTITNDIPTKPNPPSSFSVTANSSSQITAIWSSVSGVSDSSTGSYELQRSRSPNSGYQVVYSGKERTFVDTGLLANTVYYYRVRARTTEFSDFADTQQTQTQAPSLQPDLIPESLTVSSQTVTAGQLIKGSVRVKNQGQGDAVGGATTFYFHKGNAGYSNLISTQQYSTVPAGQYQTVHFSYTVPADTVQGTYIISCRVDDKNTETRETNENNNTGAVSIQVKSSTPPANTAPSIIKSLTNPTNPLAGQPTTMSAFWTDPDQGDNIVNNRFRIKPSGGTFGSPVSMAFIPGSGSNPRFDGVYTFPSAGIYTIEFIASDQTTTAEWQGSRTIEVVNVSPWNLTTFTSTITPSGILTVQIQFDGNASAISSDITLIPANGNADTPHIEGSFQTKTSASGESASVMYHSDALVNLVSGNSYKARIQYMDSSGNRQTAFSNTFVMPSVSSSILSLTGPSYQITPSSQQTLHLRVSSIITGNALVHLTLTPSGGSGTTPLPVKPNPLWLQRGLVEQNLTFTAPTSTPIGGYDGTVSLWLDTNGNGNVDLATDTRVTPDKSVPNLITLFAGNDPSDTNNDGVKDSWLTDHQVIDIHGDDDGDGNENWKEFVFNLDPNKIDDVASSVKVYKDSSSGLRYADFTYRRRKSIEGIYAFVLETSRDLKTWEDASICFQKIGAIDHGDGAETVTFRCNVPLQDDPTLMVRARVFRNFTNGPDTFLQPTQVLINSNLAKINGLTLTNNQSPSVPYLLQTAGIDLSSIGLQSAYGLFAHLKHHSDIAASAFITPNPPHPIPSGHLVFFGDPSLDMHLRVALSQQATGENLEYLAQIRAHGLVGVSQGNGHILVPDLHGNIVSVDVRNNGLDYLGAGITQELFLGSIDPVDAQLATRYPVEVQEDTIRMSRLLTTDPIYAHAENCEDLSTTDFSGYHDTNWDDLVLPPQSLGASVAILLKSGWRSVPLSAFYNNGPLNKESLRAWLLSQLSEAVFPENSDPITIYFAVCASNLPVKHRLNVLSAVFVTPSGDPVSKPKDEGTGQNEFAFDSSSTGELEMKLEVHVPGSSSLSVLEQSRFAFEIDSIGGSQKKWHVLNLGGRPLVKNDMLTAQVTFTGLPELNSDFGRKTVRIKYDGILIAEDDFEVFFSRDATNHPSGQAGSPNWFYYWRQFIPLGRIKTLHFADLSTLPNEPYGATAQSDRIVWLDQKSSGLNDITNSQGLHTFYEIISHENHHIVLWEEWWGIEGDVMASSDTDNDRYPDSFERSQMGVSYGFVVGQNDSYDGGVSTPILTANFPNNSSGFNYEEDLCQQIERDIDETQFDHLDWSFDPRKIHQGKNHK